MNIFTTLYFLILLLMLLFGNFTKLLNTSLNTQNNSINILELLLYVMTTLYFICKKNHKIPFFINSLIIISITSLFIGIFKFGLDIEGMSYNFRFVLQLLTSVLIGKLLIECYPNVLFLIKHYIFLYFFISIIAFIIFIIFPESYDLWAFNSKYNIIYSGDPHSNRLISQYFDPNFYSVIIVLPILFCGFYFFQSNKFLYLFIGIFFILQLLLTQSRTGISLFVFILLFLLVYHFLIFIFNPFMVIKIKFFKLFLIVFSFILFVLFYYHEYLLSIYDKIVQTSHDESANARLISFYLGNKLIFNEPILGYGYNFSITTVKQYDRIGLDSSIQTIILNYGLILSFLILCTFLIEVRKLYLCNMNKENRHFKSFRDIFLIYLMFVIFWASNFNQILFYPFYYSNYVNFYLFNTI